MVNTTYKCEHCGYTASDEGYIEEHEENCSQNPKSINNKRLKKWREDKRLRELTHL